VGWAKAKIAVRADACPLPLRALSVAEVSGAGRDFAVSPTRHLLGMKPCLRVFTAVRRPLNRRGEV